MSYGVTPEGFVKKTLVEIKAELETSFKAAFGQSFDVSAESKAGQIIGILSKAMADHWDLMEEVYTSRNVNEATGASLDNILSEVGLVRIDAAPTQATGVLLWGDQGTVIAAGKKASISATGKTFELQSQVTISSTTVRGVRFSAIDPPGIGTVYSFMVDDKTVTYTSIADDTAEDVVLGLIASADANDLLEGSVHWATDLGDGVIQVANIIKADWSLSNVSANLTPEAYANAGDFDCTETGPISCPTYALDTITTPVIGWLEVVNPFVGFTGRNTETDAEFRIRHSSYYAVGKGTEDAISQTLLNEVDGVISVKVISNRKDIEVDGMPPHSLQVVIEGGGVDEICRIIWDTAPAGICIYWDGYPNVGANTAYVTDSEGFEHLVGFSRPSDVAIYVRVVYSVYDEETFPLDGIARIKQAIVDWSNNEYNSGKDVIRQRLNIPLYSVPGIGDARVYIALTPINADQVTPTTVLPMNDSQVASFDVSRISVVEE